MVCARPQFESGEITIAMATAGWETRLVRNKQGLFLPCLNNITLILAHADEWRNVIAYDAFAGTIIKRKPPPWAQDIAPDGTQAPRLAKDSHSKGDWLHEDTLRTAVQLAQDWTIYAPPSMVADAVRIVADRYVVHPVRDYLNEHKWDRKPRIDTLLIRCAGAEDTLYTRAVTANFFIGAVARIWQPGAKVDTMLILEGEQGIGKSTFFRILAGDKWFLETSIDIGTKDGYQALRSKWIGEMGELDALNRSEVSRIKQFLSATKDTYRPPYGATMIDFLRQCVFGGSVNLDGAGYLKDVTGARRFNPLRVGKIDLKIVREERHQLWAEATFRYRKGEAWHIKDPRILKAAAAEAEERRQADPWETYTRKWLATHQRDVKGVTTEEILTRAIGMTEDRQGRAEQSRAGQVLRAIGWSTVKRGTDNVRRYFPKKK